MAKVLAGGCFNHIHLGHVHFLNEAKKTGGDLCVVLTHDKNNHKASFRPGKERLKNLAVLKIADEIVMGWKDDFLGLTQEIGPGVIALGYDQEMPEELEDYVKENQVKIRRISKLEGYEKDYLRFMARLQAGKVTEQGLSYQLQIAANPEVFWKGRVIDEKVKVELKFFVFQKGDLLMPPNEYSETKLGWAVFLSGKKGYNTSTLEVFFDIAPSRQELEDTKWLVEVVFN